MEGLQAIQRECITQVKAILAGSGILYKDIVTFEYTTSIFLTVPYKAKKGIIDILLQNNIGVIHNTDENLILINPLDKHINGIELDQKRCNSFATERKPKEKKETKKYKKVKQTGQLNLFD